MRPYLNCRIAIALLAAAVWLSPRLASFSGAQTAPPPEVWKLVNLAPAAPDDPQVLIRPTQFKTFALDAALLGSKLATAPMEFTQQAQNGGRVEVTLPMPDGKMARFLAEESPIMEAPLAAKFPDIKTYRAQGVDDPAATARFSLSRAGLHAIILSPSGAYYIDPYRRGDAIHHLSYFKRDLERTDAHGFECQVLLPDGRDASSLSADTASAAPVKRANGATLRTYRLALAANFEYSDFHSEATPIADKAEVMANGLVPTINRVNGIYEREVAVRMVFVANNDLIIFNTPADPYENSEGLQMLAANQPTCDGAIGPTNYDIGHVVSTGGGGVAFLGVVCSVQKAGGVTGLPSPTGDAFYVDYVAHEMGHQFGGNHTFNGNVSNCAGGNRNPETAYEPGSGSTIQAYAGICPPQNLQRNSDPYFHTISYDEILDHVTGEADSCAVKTDTGNTAPDVEAGPDFNIPARTPFTLTATATDADGDVLSYAWEQFDLGPTNDGQSDNGSSPILRSYNPTPIASRTFPSERYILNNNNTPPLTYPCGPGGTRTCMTGEVLPTTTRALKFRVTARDNRAGGGGVEYDQMQVNVTDTAEPFAVTFPNGGESMAGETTQTVSWNVAGTAAAPINTANVDINLSIDGGQTYPIVLATGVPNDGSQAVTIPLASTTQARIRVTGSGNIFFDVSNADFSIASPVPQLTGAVSRKTHGTTAFDINLPLDGTPGVECRSGGAAGGHTLIFTFAEALTSAGATVMSGSGSVTGSSIGPDANQYTVQLGGVANAQFVTVRLTDLNGVAGSSASVSVGMLLGDVNATQVVDGNDVSAVQARTRQSANEANFKTDVNTTGRIDGNDVSAVQGKTRTSLP